VALTISDILEFNYNLDEKDCNDKRGVDFVKQKLEDILKIIQVENEINVKKNLIDFMHKINIDTKFSKLNIDEKGLELILQKGFTPDRMNNNPRKINKEQLRKILEGLL
jgi:alcohol dehydrogenase class IV